MEITPTGRLTDLEQQQLARYEDNTGLVGDWERGELLGMRLRGTQQDADRIGRLLTRVKADRARRKPPTKKQDDDARYRIW
jgi:hypothetical protein